MDELQRAKVVLQGLAAEDGVGREDGLEASVHVLQSRCDVPEKFWSDSTVPGTPTLDCKYSMRVTHSQWVYAIPN